MTINVIVIDDEHHARQALINSLSKFSEINIVAECENGLVAVKAIHECSPQVIFLDINMPKLDGFDVLDLLGEDAPLTVFVTAHDEYAIQAFENNALDYLLKPVSAERLVKTVERIQNRIKSDESNNSKVNQNTANHDLVQQHQQTQAPVNRILVREKGDVFVIAVTDVIAIEAADDYVVIHTQARKYIKQERLSNLESILDSGQFCRIHRSTIINLDFLSGIETEGKESRSALLKTGQQFAVSRSGYAKLVAVL